ncbi:MAG: hypothetical protein IKP17_10395 [Oscillospiraceae bacterium]|nr:hypothetical protein [Oscillospiraceae bacterium]
MKRTKRLLSLALVLLLALGLLPGAVLADGDVIESLDILYDTSQAFPTTRLTGAEVTYCLYNALEVPRSGHLTNSDDWYVWYQTTGNSAWTSLCYRNEDNLDPDSYREGFTSLYNSDEPLTDGREYYFRFDVYSNAKSFPADTNPTVKVNGQTAEYVYRYSSSELIAYKRVSLDESTQWAWAVDVKPDEAVVQKGTTKQFTAAVEGTTQNVTWYVNGGYASSISPSGLLTVGAGETASTLTVHAESTANTGAYDEVTVQVISEPVKIDKVEISPTSASVQRGGNQLFTVNVTGTDIHDVEWTVIGSEPITGSTSYVSANSSSDAGMLYVSDNESAETLTVRATSVADPTIYAEAAVTVLPRPQVDGTIAVTYDADTVHFLQSSTGAEVTAALTDAITCSRSGAESGSWHVYLSKNGSVYKPSSYACLCYKNSSGSYETLWNNTDALDVTKEYYLRFNIENNSGYEFDPDHIPAVTVNGEAAEDVRWNSRSYIGELYAYKRIQMEDLFLILAQPEDFSGTVGETAVFHVSFGGNASFQWQYSTDEVNWTDSGATGNKTDTLRIGVTVAREKYYYRCKITGSGGQVLYTDSVRLHALASVDDSLNVPGGSLHFGTSGAYPWEGTAVDGVHCAQSGNAGVNSSDSDLTLSLSVSEASILSFEYYVSGEHSSSSLFDRGELHLDGTEIAEFQTSETGVWRTYALILEPGAHTVLWRYHKDGSNSSGDDCFRLRNVALSGMTATVAVQPVDFTGAVGETFTFHTEAIGTDPSYQWQVSTDGGASWKNSGHSGSATDTMTGTITAARLGHLFRCKITSSGSTIYSNTVRILETPLEITSQPGSYTTWVGSPFTFTVTARGSGLSYQWQVLLSGESEWQDCAFSGSDTAELSDVMTQDLFYATFRCVVTDRLGNEAVSSPVLLYSGGIQIDVQPASLYREIGEAFSFSVGAQGSLLTYQWQVSTDGGETWKNTSLSGNKTAAIHGTMKAAYQGYFYRCVLTDCFGFSNESKPAALFTLAMLDAALNAPGGSLHFTTDLPYTWFPTTSEGQSAAASSNQGVNASNSDLYLQCALTQPAPLTFEYFVDGEHSETSLYDRGELYVDGTEIESFRASASGGWQTYTLTLEAGEHTVKWRYHKDGSQSTGDDIFMLRNVSLPCGEPLAITAQPEDYVGPLGSTATFTVEATGSGLTYQWWVKKPSASSFSKSSITGPIYSVALTSARNGNRLYCVVSDAFGNSVQSDTVSMTVGEALTVADLEDYVGPLGSTATFTVEATGTGLTYQWYVKNRTATKFSKSSITSAAYSVTLTEDNSGRQLYCVVTDSHGNTVKTNTVSMTVAAPMSVGDLSDYTGPVGSTAAFTVSAGGEGPFTYQWWVKKPTATKFSKSSIAGDTYSVELTEARNGNQIYCVVTDAYGQTARTNTVTMSIG